MNKDYPVPDSGGLILKKGMTVAIPVYGIHHDPEFYNEPEQFNPDRFAEDEIRKRNPFAFLPFGEGPRVCIGMRFGMMQTRVGLAKLLIKFRVTPCEKTVIPMRFTQKDFALTADGGVCLNVEKIE